MFTVKNGVILIITVRKPEVVKVSGIYNKFDGSYTGKPWKNVGQKDMIEVVNLLATKKHNGDITPFVRASEVFFVHLSDKE